MRAFAGESMARNRYNMAASTAFSEGHHAIGRIFDFTAKQEQAHATVFYGFLKDVNDTNFDICAAYPVNVYDTTQKHLEAAVKNEYEEYESAYKSFGDTAKAEGFNTIANAFYKISEIEKIHGDRFDLFLKALQSSSLYKGGDDTIWVCTNCGHIHIGKKAPEMCPVCAHPQAYFMEKANNY